MAKFIRRDQDDLQENPPERWGYLGCTLTEMMLVPLLEGLIIWCSSIALAPMSQRRTVFLTAEWRDLVMLNYEVDPCLLEKFVPSGTVLDSFAGKTYVSLVGFRFCSTKLFGFLAIPFHSDFDEVNLRFYVRHRDGDENRRGVVFIAEIVPK